MPGPITALEVIQRATEVTPGTLVAATRRVQAEPGSIDLSPIEQDTIRRRYTGSLATSHQTSTGLERAGISYETRGYYDDLAIDLSMFLGPAVITGAGADKVWTFTPSDSADTLKRMSYEVGGRDTWPSEEKLAGCVGSSLTITWSKEDDWMESLELLSMRNTQAAKASVTNPTTLVPILGRTTRLFVDPTTFGTTSQALGISGEITIETGVDRRYGTDGNAYANRIAVIGPRVVSCNFVAEYDAATLRTAWRAGTVQKVRIESPGPTLGSTTYNARFDIVGTFDTQTIGEDNGVITVEHELVATYDTTLAADIQAVVTCSLTALP